LRQRVRPGQGGSVVFFLTLFLLACGMAAHAVLEIQDPLLAMLPLDLQPVVLVTVVAGVGRQVIGVAGLARAEALLPVI